MLTKGAQKSTLVLKGEVRFDWRDQGLGCEIALLLASPAVTCGATAEVLELMGATFPYSQGDQQSGQ
jgi:hypothetical protein